MRLRVLLAVLVTASALIVAISYVAVDLTDPKDIAAKYYELRTIPLSTGITNAKYQRRALVIGPRIIYQLSLGTGPVVVTVTESEILVHHPFRLLTEAEQQLVGDHLRKTFDGRTIPE